jgi:N-carbamoyl-L-amino-acid hydrolase
MTVANLDVKIDRVLDELGSLARLSDAPAPAVTRVVYTDADSAARALIKDLCADLDLAVRVDPIGNTFARWEGSRPDLPPVGTGSHIDAIPHSGRFDGTVGVLGALAAIRTLQAAGFRPVLPIELLMFTSEEPTRFGIGCLGSRVLSGSLSAHAAAALRDQEGRTLDEVRRAAGFVGDLSLVMLPEDYLTAFVELHIEQGTLLEESGFPIGIVTAIAAPAALRVALEGEGGHAGTVLMPDRKDALCAAAEAVLAVESIARSSGSADTVATTGVCRVHPGAINSIPDRVVLEIDVRDIDLSRRDSVLTAITAEFTAIARRRSLRASLECLSSDPPAQSSSVVIAAIRSACTALQLKSLELVSRAYHDSLFMARIAPTGMIFIPCKDGISHRPDEHCEPEAIARGVEVLALTLARLAGG